VLSFKGLSYNLAYGLIGVLYSLLLALLRSEARTSPPTIGDPVENLIFTESITWFPWYFLLALTALFFFSRSQLKSTTIHKMAG
jgi:hypothetical protein